MHDFFSCTSGSDPRFNDGGKTRTGIKCGPGNVDQVLNSRWKTPNPDVEWIKFKAGPAMDNKTAGSNLQIVFLKYSLLAVRQMNASTRGTLLAKIYYKKKVFDTGDENVEKKKKECAFSFYK